MFFLRVLCTTLEIGRGRPLDIRPGKSQTGIYANNKGEICMVQNIYLYRQYIYLTGGKTVVILLCLQAHAPKKMYSGRL